MAVYLINSQRGAIYFINSQREAIKTTEEKKVYYCVLWVCHFPIGILGVWYLIVLIPDLCTLTYFYTSDQGPELQCLLKIKRDFS